MARSAVTAIGIPTCPPRCAGPVQLRLHTAVETADLLGGCSETHVRRLTAAGELRIVDIATPGARRPKIRIRSDDLAAYIDRNSRVLSRPAGPVGRRA